MTDAATLLVLAPHDGPTAAIGAAMIAAGRYVAAGETGPVDAVLIDGFDTGGGTPFLDVSDAAFRISAIEATLDRVAALQAALERVAPGGHIVLIGSDAHLGHWHGPAQGAASAALIGMMRSVAMEYGRSGLTVNLVALPLGSIADDATLVAGAALQVATLFAARSITGETILMDRGDSLKLRQARRR